VACQADDQEVEGEAVAARDPVAGGPEVYKTESGGAVWQPFSNSVNAAESPPLPSILSLPARSMPEPRMPPARSKRRRHRVGAGQCRPVRHFDSGADGQTA
jgi:hypothetical protein